MPYGPRPPGASKTFISPELGFNRPYTLFGPVNQSTLLLSKVTVFKFALGWSGGKGKTSQTFRVGAYDGVQPAISYPGRSIRPNYHAVGT